MILAGVAFLVLLLIGMPVAIVLGVTGTIHTITLGNPAYLLVVIQRLYDQLNSTSLTCIPFFILAGEIMNAGGVTRRLLDFVREIIGWLRGGMAYACVVIAAILSAILGSPNGVASMLCGVLVPELRKDGYDEEFTGSLVAASSILGPIIPPSTTFVLYCLVANTSIKAMFVGGIVPGLFLVAMFCGLIAFYTRKFNYKKSIHKISLARIGKTFVVALPALLVPGVIIGGVMGGFFTATEAGAVSCFCAILASIIYRDMDWKKLPAVFLKGAVTGGGILLMVSFAGVIGWSMARSGLANMLVDAITSVTTNRVIITLIIIAILLVAGCLLEAGTITMVLNPVLMPLALAVGFDPVHFGLIFCILIVVGYITPPVGMVLFVTASSADIPFNKLCKMIWPFAIGAMIITIILAFTPDLVLWLPRMFGYTG